VVHISHQSIRKEATFFIPGTKGVEIYETVAPGIGEEVIIKNYPNSFIDTGFGEFLKSHKIKDLVICGMMSHMCVEATVRAAFDKGYNNTVVYDACATRSLEFNGKILNAEDVHASSMAAISFVYGKTISTSDFLSN